jgi:CRP-like cAMP-binding protein
VEVWAIDRRTFREAVKQIAADTFRDKKQFIETISLFKHLNWEECDLLVSCLIQNKFDAGQTIVRENDTGTELYIISEGSVSVTKTEEDEEGELVQRELRKMTEGEYFGE